jgi:hypothetical protein
MWYEQLCEVAKRIQVLSLGGASALSGLSGRERRED